MARYARTEDILIEPVGHLWATYCPASGETLLLNDESASILEVLLDSGPADAAAVAAALVEDSGMSTDSLEGMIEASWPQLLAAGLVHRLHATPTMSR